MYSNEVVYLLDLCILSYHLHSQTLIWPMDPYYEQVKKKLGSRRNNFMSLIRQTFDFQTKPGYHGPGSSQGDDNSGWRTNPHLDPIISQ